MVQFKRQNHVYNHRLKSFRIRESRKTTFMAGNPLIQVYNTELPIHKYVGEGVGQMHFQKSRRGTIFIPVEIPKKTFFKEKKTIIVLSTFKKSKSPLHKLAPKLQQQNNQKIKYSLRPCFLDCTKLSTKVNRKKPF